ncbi:hypothetical protein [Streptomyces sp. NPDC048489]|uniref:hypothetical protein n=1 Tax=Streptomyces sp. NPDC048489 TaxID=3154504 RepID=UPI00344353BC
MTSQSVTAAEAAERRRAVLGDALIAHIHEVVDAAPDPTPELVAELRRIFARPVGPVSASRQAWRSVRAVVPSEALS